MGLAADEALPLEVRIAHTCIMRFRFPPTPGYAALRALAAPTPRPTPSPIPAENVFMWTSNVDGCFERSGFDQSRVYTTQGEMKIHSSSAVSIEPGHTPRPRQVPPFEQ